MHELSGILVGSSRKSKAIEIAHGPASMGEWATPGNVYKYALLRPFAISCP